MGKAQPVVVVAKRGALIGWASALVLVLPACSGNDYSEEVRENFLAACHLSSGGEDTGCECLLGHLEDNMSEEEFLELEEETLAEAEDPQEAQELVLKDPRFAEAVEDCGGDA